MSNWSRVMVCWSGIDDEASEPVEIDRRAGALCGAGYAVYRDATVYSCPELDGGRLGGPACEVTVIFDCNHFDPGEFLDVLRGMPWEKPEEVEVFWKDEEADVYARRALTEETP